MIPTSLGEVQQTGLDMLKYLEATCNAEGLSYFLAYGSALGAYRDGAQIDWDWDIDVLVPSPDYGALVQALRHDLPDRYIVADNDSVDYYPSLFSRIAMRDVDQALVHIDLFPLSAAPSRKSLQRLQYCANRLLARVHLLKSIRPKQDKPHYGPAKRSATVAVKLAFVLLSRKSIRKFHRWLNFSIPYTTAQVVHNPCGSNGLCEYFPKRWFSSSVLCDFSGQASRIPKGTGEMLRSIYGRDFMTPVPRSAQEAAITLFEHRLEPRLKRAAAIIDPTGP